MSSSITLVVPRVEKEAVFLQVVVQAAIRAYRDHHLKIHEAKTDALNGDCRSALQVDGQYVP